MIAIGSYRSYFDMRNDLWFPNRLRCGAVQRQTVAVAILARCVAGHRPAH